MAAMSAVTKEYSLVSMTDKSLVDNLVPTTESMKGLQLEVKSVANLDASSVEEMGLSMVSLKVDSKDSNLVYSKVEAMVQNWVVRMARLWEWTLVGDSESS
jgi:hypothetical protein